ncbi:MAG: hypothetical protein ACLFUP_07015 [Desulfobacteraceae bacterium]
METKLTISSAAFLNGPDSEPSMAATLSPSRKVFRNGNAILAGSVMNAVIIEAAGFHFSGSCGRYFSIICSS